MEKALRSPQARTRDAGRTREVLLRAAQRLFAVRGYTATGVREVASEAGVNPNLIRRYFGSKEDLLRVALEDLLSVEPIITGDRSQFGERAANMLSQADSIANPVAIMMLAIADPKARKLCSELVQDNVIAPLALWLGGQDSGDRAVQLNVLWTGFIAQRQLTPLPQLDDAHVGPTRRWVAELSQAIADG